MASQFGLLKRRRFLPVFAAQFLGAFNDNLFKSTLSVVIAYGLWDAGGWRPEILVSLAAGIFILPFVIFSPLAGRLADKCDKARLIRVLKVAEILIVLLAIAGLYSNSVFYMVFMLFLLGAHSAFFSPAKFSILPQHLQRSELIAGNALLNTGVYLAILGGTMLGSWLGGIDRGFAIAAAVLGLLSLSGLIASFFILPAPAPSPDLKIRLNIFSEAFDVMTYTRRLPQGVFQALIGSAWFFFTGSLYLAQLPNYASGYLRAEHTVLTFFIGLFSIGIAAGGLLNHRVLKTRIEATFVPAALAVMAVFSLDLLFASKPYTGEGLQSLPDFLSGIRGWRILVDLFAIAAAGGVYIVPLKAILQDRTPEGYRARVMACSAMTDALFILAAALMAIGLFALGFQVVHLFVMVSAFSVLVILYLRNLAGGIFSPIGGRQK